MVNTAWRINPLNAEKTISPELSPTTTAAGRLADLLKLKLKYALPRLQVANTLPGSMLFPLTGFAEIK